MRSGSTIALRAALATVLMYLLFIAFQLMGTAGVVITSLLFLVSLFAPTLVKLARDRELRRKSRAGQADSVMEPAAQTEE